MDEGKFQTLIAMIPTLTVEKLTKLMTKTREAKMAASRAFDIQDKKFQEIMTTCQNFLLSEADKAGVTGFKTDYGTSYAAVTTKISIADEDTFYKFLAAQPDGFDFFEKRVSSTHVDNYMKANGGTAPPGLTIFRERQMRVRKAADK